MKITSAGGSHTHELQPDDPPRDVREWLHHRGWYSAANYGYFSRHDVLNDNGIVATLTWEQAVAYEAYKLITIGGHSG